MENHGRKITKITKITDTHFTRSQSSNVPLYFIRLKMKALDKNVHYVAREIADTHLTYN
jgi:hypothetical protein